MAKKKSKKDAEAKAAEQRAAAEKKVRARLAALKDDAKKARKAADAAVKKAEKAEAKAAAAGASSSSSPSSSSRPEPEQKPDELELLKLALRSAEARLTDAERKVEALEQQLTDRDRLADDEAEEAIEDAIVQAAVEATVEDAIVDAGLDGSADAATVEAVAIELDEVATEAEPAPEEPSHDGEAEEAAAVFEQAEPSANAEGLTPPLPDDPGADAPNASWTLIRLRDEAKRRGLTGTSNLPKAALLERLQA